MVVQSFGFKTGRQEDDWSRSGSFQYWKERERETEDWQEATDYGRWRLSELPLLWVLWITMV